MADQIDIAAFADALPTERRRAEAVRLDAIFREATGWQPRSWGKLIGYGQYQYTYASGRSGTSLATGFGINKAKIALHIMPGYADHSAILARLGKHSTGAACVYLNGLADADTAVLHELIRAGLRNLATYWPVDPS
ncbi:MAG: DUF1801 domain-containing protein [Pseudomonadota bacterium]